MHTLSTDYNLLCKTPADLIYSYVINLFRNYMWDFNHHKQFILGLLAVNEFCICIVLILGNITILLIPLIIWYTVFDVKLLFTSMVFTKVFCCGSILHYVFHVGVSKIRPKLILHRILDVYKCIHIINKGLSIVQKMNMWYDSP